MLRGGPRRAGIENRSRRMPFEAGGLGAGRHVPQTDRVVTRARGEPPVRQQAEGTNRTRMPFEPGGLSAGRLTSHSRIVLSLEPEASRPSGSRQSDVTELRVPFEAGGLGSSRHVPQTDRVVDRSPRRAARRQHAEGIDAPNALRGGRSRRRSPRPTAGSSCPASPRRAARPAAGRGRSPRPNALRGGRSRRRSPRPTVGSCCR